MIYSSLRKAFTLSNILLGFNDHYIGMNRTYEYFSYLHKFNRIKSWVLIDIGAHQGTFSRRAKRLLDVSEIILVEPNIDLLVDLRNNFPGAKLINAAVTIDQGKLFYVRNNKNSGQNFVSKEYFSNEQVESIRINDVFRRIENLEGIILLKLDIEGGELSILRDIDKFNLNRVGLISVEILPTIDTQNFFYNLDDFMPRNFQFYRETRFGMIPISRVNPHWSDKLNHFQNLLLVNSHLVKN